MNLEGNKQEIATAIVEWLRDEATDHAECGIRTGNNAGRFASEELMDAADSVARLYGVEES